MRLRARTSRRRCPRHDRRHARRGSGRPRRAAALVRGHAQRPRASPDPESHGRRPPRRSSSTPPTSSRCSLTAGAAGASDDLVGVLCQAEIDGDSLDEASLIHETLLILIGGDETTRHVHQRRHGGAAGPARPARRGWPADPSLLPVAVEEMLRWVTPIKNMARTATRDVELRRRTHHGGPGGDAALSVGQPGRGSVRRSRQFRYRRGPQPAPSLRLRRPLLPGQPAGPAGAPGDVRAALWPACPTSRLAVARDRTRSGRPTSSAASRPCRSSSPRARRLR